MAQSKRVSTLCGHMWPLRPAQCQPGSHHPKLLRPSSKTWNCLSAANALASKTSGLSYRSNSIKPVVLLTSCCRRAGQHPPNLQKIYPAQAKRVRKAPQRYSGGQVLPTLLISHCGEHSPAQLHSHSGLTLVYQPLTNASNSKHILDNSTVSSFVREN